MKQTMINVTESAVNLCLNHLIFADSSTELYNYYLDSVNNISSEGFPKPNRLYAGAEFCDKIFKHIRHTKFFDHLTHLNQYVEHVSFVIPPMHESTMEYFTGIMDVIEQCTFVDELVFNDFGIMRYLHQYYPQYTLVAGRLMDKGMREARFVIYSDLEKAHNNRKILQSTNLDAPFYRSLFKQYGVDRIELDTLNGGKLLLNMESGMNYTVHYPRIFLSRSDYCEFSGVGKKLSEKFRIQGSCTRMCGSVWEELCDPSESGIYKIGNAAFTTQKEKLIRCVNGTFRLVYSQGEKNESRCSNSFF